MRNLLAAALGAGIISLLANTVQAGPDQPDGAPRKAAPAYTRVETPRYVVEVPTGWAVSDETPFGQREITPVDDPTPARASMSTMTGPGLGRQSWDDLYKTSNYYITRYSSEGSTMKATPYRIGKTRQGLESCSWTMTHGDGTPIQRHVILKRADSDILALSVKVPATAGKQDKQRLESMFKHLVDTAVMR